MNRVRLTVCSEWTIHVCRDCGVQYPPHGKKCPQARHKWFETRPVRVVEAADAERRFELGPDEPDHFEGHIGANIAGGRYDGDGAAA